MINLQISEVASVDSCDCDDFIKKAQFDQASQSLFLIHQKFQIDILQNHHNITNFFSKKQPKTTNLKFQSVIYDSKIVNGTHLLVSNRQMPVRLYNINQPQDFISFYDKKTNSQIFLSPIMLAAMEGTVIGGGKKFLSVYDINKVKIQRIKLFEKKYISSVEIMNKNFAVVGSFEGNLDFIDLRQPQQMIHSFAPHVDLVTRIKSIPMHQNNLITIARKDNYSYLWDIRKLDQFLEVYQNRLYGNQRTGLQVTKDEMIFFGGQKGQIICKNMEGGIQVGFHQTNKQQCVNDLCLYQNKIIGCVGERSFPLEETVEKSSVKLFKFREQQ